MLIIMFINYNIHLFYINSWLVYLYASYVIMGYLDGRR